MCLCNVWDNRHRKSSSSRHKIWIAHTCVTNTYQNTTDNRNKIIKKEKRTIFTCFKKFNTSTKRKVTLKCKETNIKLA